MMIIVLLLFVSLLIALVFLGAYIWAVRTGQFDDQYSPAVTMFSDRSTRKLPHAKNKNSTQQKSTAKLEKKIKLK